MRRKMILLYFSLHLGVIGDEIKKQPAISLPKLTKEQMLEDFDKMTKVVCDAFPSCVANRMIYGIDIFEKLKSFRERIRGNETPEEFAAILYWALTACKGNHLWTSNILAHSYSKNEPNFTKIIKLLWNLDESAIEVTDAYFKVLDNKFSELEKRVSVHLLYHKGNYYTSDDFSWKGKNYKRGMKLISVNDKTPFEILPAIQDQLEYFDPEKRLFHSSMRKNIGSSFYVFMDQEQTENQKFKFEDEGGMHELIFSKGEQPNLINTPQNIYIKSLSKAVDFFEDKGILYLRIPEMNPTEISFYLKGIKEKASNKKIEAIVLDVRCNGGGSSLVWLEVLKFISAKEYRWKSRWAIKNTEIAKDYELRHARARAIILGKSHEIAVPNWDKQERISFLDDEEFLVKEDENILSPRPDSLRLTAPIYIIAHDIYSATGSMISFAKCTDSVTCVGTRNPMSLGEGIDPLLVSLPNSKMIISVGTHLDLTGCRSPDDTLQSRMEVEVDMTVTELLNYLYGNIDNNTLEERLVKNDPYFKKILELNAASK